MAIIEAINRPNRTYKGLRQALRYILSPQKTQPHLVTGIDCLPERAYEEMILVKKEFGKWDGKQFSHLVQSFASYDNVTPEKAHAIAQKFLQHEMFKGFQVVAATHVDAGHLHTHFIINSVNAETGKKWHTTKQDLQSFKEFSDKLCIQENLHTLQEAYKKNPRISPGEYRAAKRGQSWKRELYLVASHCLRNSTSKEDFIQNMSRMGYGVNWTDKHKYITFTTPNGKVSRNRNWERFSKENMLETFKLNKEFMSTQDMSNAIESLFRFLKSFSSQTHSSGKLPMSHLEGQALRERMIEHKFGSNMDWGTSWEP